MNIILAHTSKKFKLVYDRTIVMKTGWVDQSAILQGKYNFSQFMPHI